MPRFTSIRCIKFPGCLSNAFAVRAGHDIHDNRAVIVPVVVAIDPRLAEAQRGQSPTYPDREKEVGRMLLAPRRVEGVDR